ncbi:MAG: methylmalonyl-CoA mutase family protein, partial [Actinomycetota bacterium]
MTQERRTDSGIEIQPVYTPADAADIEGGEPGEFPFVRGVYKGMYRDRLWT